MQSAAEFIQKQKRMKGCVPVGRAYSYPTKYLWDPETWQGREAEIQPLVNFLTRKLYEDVRPVSKTGMYLNRTDGVFNPKTKAVTLPEVPGYWQEQGMELHITSMGGASWIALLPLNLKMDTPVLLSFHSADTSDKFWAMDTLEYFKELGKRAAKSGTALVFIIQDTPCGSGIFGDILLEVSSLWRLNLKPLYLNATHLDKIPENFEALEMLDVPVIEITDRWQSRVAHQFIVGNLNRGNPEFDFDRLINSPLGRHIADSMQFEYSYDRWDDPALLGALRERGVLLEGHFLAGERYLTAGPMSAPERGKKLPLLVCMKEVRPTSEFQTLTALQFYAGFLEMVACGELRLLFFAMESPDDNELLNGILDVVERDYEIDSRRIYITGQSHNGYLALKYAERHLDRIAAIATLNDRHGIAAPRYATESVPVTDEMVEHFSAHDLPLINICGQIENVFPHTTPGTQGYENAIDAYHRRLRAFRCPDRTDEEIKAALTSPDLATRKNGVPADRTEVLYAMGHEVYVSDIYNVEGKCHLRLVTLENLPHMISPQMAELAWTFLRRFVREADGSIAELDRQKSGETT